jgi:hypothetical protein
VLCSRNERIRNCTLHAAVNAPTRSSTMTVVHVFGRVRDGSVSVQSCGVNIKYLMCRGGIAGHEGESTLDCRAASSGIALMPEWNNAAGGTRIATGRA